jgi:universal stress protein A
MNTDKPSPTTAAQQKPVCKPQRVLVPVDFSDNCKEALPYALQFAQQFGARIYLVHIIEPSPMLPDVRDLPLALSDKEVALKIRGDLEVLAEHHFKGAIPVESIVRTGKAHQAIVDLADELRVELIVISTHGYTGLKRTLLGSTTERVVREAHCPVLVVRRTQPVLEEL